MPILLSTIPACACAGHNLCLHCGAQLQRAKPEPECPLCRSPFPAAVPLVVNRELRDLVALAAALGTVEQTDGWQAITSQVWHADHMRIHPTDVKEGKGPHM